MPREGMLSLHAEGECPQPPTMHVSTVYMHG